jgi:hypothetical protein
MKKMIMMAGIAVFNLSIVTDAAINVAWRNTQSIFFNNAVGAGNQIGADFYHILIWSPTAAPAEDYAQPGTGVGSGEVILFQGNAGILGGQFNYAAQPFFDADVGNFPINTGYIYSRIFQFSTVSEGDQYWESPVSMNFGPALTVFDPDLSPPDPNQIIQHTAPNVAAAILMDPATVNVYTVVPEPSVMALIGMGGLLIAIRRRRMIA